MLTDTIHAFKRAYIAQFASARRPLSNNPLLPYTLMCFTDAQLDSQHTTEHHARNHDSAFFDLHDTMLQLPTYDPDETLDFNVNQLRLDLLDACTNHINAPIAPPNALHKLTSSISAFDLAHYRTFASDPTIIPFYFVDMMLIVHSVNLRTPRHVLYTDLLDALDYTVDRDDLSRNNPSPLLTHSFFDPRLISYYLRMYAANEYAINRSFNAYPVRMLAQYADFQSLHHLTRIAQAGIVTTRSLDDRKRHDRFLADHFASIYDDTTDDYTTSPVDVSLDYARAYDELVCAVECDHLYAFCVTHDITLNDDNIADVINAYTLLTHAQLKSN